MYIQRTITRGTSITIYLRNLKTHIVNNLQQKLNCVKLIQISEVKQNFNIIHIMCDISEQYL